MIVTRLIELAVIHHLLCSLLDLCQLLISTWLNFVWSVIPPLQEALAGPRAAKIHLAKFVSTRALIEQDIVDLPVLEALILQQEPPPALKLSFWVASKVVGADA